MHTTFILLDFKVGELPGFQDKSSDDDTQSDIDSLKGRNVPTTKMETDELKVERKIHAMSDSDDNVDSPKSNDDLKTESENDSQDVLNMSPSLI